jgi:hypothetical protein
MIPAKLIVIVLAMSAIAPAQTQTNTTAAPICPAGYTFNITREAGWCEETITAQAGCNLPGLTFNSTTGLCEGIYSFPPPCYPGFPYNSTTGRCAAFVELKPICTPGWSLIGPFLCETTLMQPPICPAGYTYNIDT